MKPPIPPPNGDVEPQAPAPPSCLGILFTAIVLGAFFLGVGGVEVLYLWNSLMHGPLPIPDVREAILWLTVGVFLTGIGIIGIIQRIQRRNSHRKRARQEK